MTTTDLQPFAPCSFCLRDYAPDDLLPLGEEVSATGHLRSTWICSKCNDRLNALDALAAHMPPVWVLSDPICSRLWRENADWRANALLATGYPATELLMAQLARRVCGGSEGEAAS